jgi:hypothetical protein
LWLVPWAALTLPGGKYVVEDHSVTYLVSGRELAGASQARKVEPTPPLVLADPDFNLGLKQAAAETRRLLDKTEAVDRT